MSILYMENVLLKNFNSIVYYSPYPSKIEGENKKVLSMAQGPARRERGFRRVI